MYCFPDKRIALSNQNDKLRQHFHTTIRMSLGSAAVAAAIALGLEKGQSKQDRAA